MIKNLFVRLIGKLRHPFFILPMVSALLVAGWLVYTYENRHLDTVSASENILQNGSFEQLDDSGFPAGWTVATTGSVSATSKTVEGYVSGFGARMDVTDYTTGTAYLSSPRMDTTVGSTYFFKSYYATDSVADIYIRSVDATGSVTFEHAKHLPDYDYPWSAMSATFTAKSAQTQIIIALSGDGYIELDGAYVTATEPEISTFVTNGNDLLADQSPKDWQISRTGEMTVQAQNNQDGASIAVNNYQSGSISWKPKPIPATPYTQYELTYDYESDSPVSLYVDYEREDGTFTYQYILTLQPTPERTQRTIRFETPTKTRSLTPSLQLASNGTLKQTMMHIRTDAVSQKFDKPRVSFTFDDGWVSSYTNGAQMLEDSNMTGTFYINPGALGRTEIMTETQAKDLLARGFELGSHSNEHIDITSFTQEYVEADLSRAVISLNRLGVNGKPNYASPYGKFDDSVLPIVMENSSSHRGTEKGINTKNNINTRNLKALFMRKELTDAQLEAMLQEAKTTNGWLILIYHQIEASQSPFALDREVFRRHIDIVQKSGIEVMTVSRALDQIQTQSK